MSGSTFPQRLSRIDDLTRPDHTYLQSDDDCLYLGDYTARQPYSFSATNQLIWNFKKSMDQQGQQGWHYKAEAIQEAATAFRVAMQADLDMWTFVPIPPSKAKGDPLYDDRVTQMIRAIRPQPPVDVRELILQTESTEAAHLSETRPSPEEIQARYSIDEALAQEPINQIAIVDDMLTAGAHYRAAKAILAQRFPTTKIIGLFISRRVPDTSEIDDVQF